MNKRANTKLFLGVFLLAFWLFFPPIMSMMGFYSSASLNSISKVKTSDTGSWNLFTISNLLLYYFEIIFSIWIPEMGVLGNLIKILAQMMTIIVGYLMIRGD